MDAALFLRVAAVAEDVVGDPRVGARWDEPSALQGYTVGGLAGHLARAVLTMDRYLDGGVAEGRQTDAPGYLVDAMGTHDPVTSGFHAKVRERGEQEAQQGPAALTARMREARTSLAGRLDGVDPEQPIAVLDDAVIAVGEYIDTRLIELVVHLDDLAVSVGTGIGDEVPPEALERVASLLARVAARRVGGLATVRSLARAERHPDAVRAL